jgi:hypothetical protein
MKYVVAIVFFLLALSCLITKVRDPSPQRNPDAADRFVWRLIFQGEPPSATPDPDRKRMVTARIVGFFLFTLMGILFIAN